MSAEAATWGKTTYTSAVTSVRMKRLVKSGVAAVAVQVPEAA
jgi:hypothetical protein